VVYEYWRTIEPHFGHWLLAPEWGAAEGRATWRWQQPAGAEPATPAELDKLRRELAAAVAKAAGEYGAHPTERPAGLTADDTLVRVLAQVGAILRGLVARTDAELAGFVCRTSAGLRLHSWGAAEPAHPFLLSQPNAEVHGRVEIEGGNPASGQVVLEDRHGNALSRVRPDARGVFVFPSVSPGLYRVRAAYPGVVFGVPDFAVNVAQDDVAGVILRGIVHRTPAVAGLLAKVERRQGRAHHRRVAATVLAALLLMGGGTWLLTRRGGADRQLTDSTRLAEDAVAAQRTQAVANEQPSPPQAVSLPPGGNNNPIQANRGPDYVVPASPPAQRNQPTTPTNLRSQREDRGQTERATSQERERPIAVMPPPARTVTETVSAGAVDRNGPEHRATAEGRPVAPVAGGRPDRFKSVANSNDPDRDRRTQNDSRSQSSPSSRGDPAATIERRETRAPDSREMTAPGGHEAPGGAAVASFTDSATAVAGELATVEAQPGGVIMVEENPRAVAGGAVGGSATAANGGVAGVRGYYPAASGALVGQTGAAPGGAARAGETGVLLAPISPRRVEGKIIGVLAVGGGGVGGGAFSGGAAPATAATTTGGGWSAPTGSQPANTGAAEETPATGDAWRRDDLAVTSTENVPIAARLGNTQKALAAPSASLPERTFGKRFPALAASMSTTLTVVVGGWRTCELAGAAAADGSDKAGELAAWRERLVKEGRLKVPLMLLDPHIEAGFAVEWHGAGDATAPEWFDEAGQPDPSSSVRGDRAEIAWRGGPGPASRACSLVQPDGRVLARVEFGPAGRVTLSTADGVRGWYWVGVTRPVEDDRQATAGEWRRRMEWRLLDGRRWPAGWSRDEAWRGGRGHRLEMPADVAAPGGSVIPFALVDRLTGWALVHEYARRVGP
jgi:hypothetical protein